MRKARVFCRAKSKNVFTVTDFGNSLPAQPSASRGEGSSATRSSNEEDTLNLLSIRLPENPPLPEVDPTPPPPPLPTANSCRQPQLPPSRSPDFFASRSSVDNMNSTFSMQQTSAFAFNNSKTTLNNKFHSSSFSNYQQHSANYSSQQLLLSRQPSMSAFSGHVHSKSMSTSRKKNTDGAKRNFSSNSFEAGNGCWDFARLSRPLYDARTWQRMSKIKVVF